MAEHMFCCLRWPRLVCQNGKGRIKKQDMAVNMLSVLFFIFLLKKDISVSMQRDMNFSSSSARIKRLIISSRWRYCIGGRSEILVSSMEWSLAFGSPRSSVLTKVQ